MKNGPNGPVGTGPWVHEPGHAAGIDGHAGYLQDYIMGDPPGLYIYLKREDVDKYEAYSNGH